MNNNRTKKLESFLIGTKNSAKSYSHRKRALLVSCFCIISVVVAGYYISADIGLGVSKFMLGYASIILMSFVTAFLNYSGQYRLAVIVQLSLLNVIIFYFSLVGSGLYQNHLFFIVSCLGALAMFEFKERKRAYLLVALSFILFIISYFDIFSITGRGYNGTGAVNFMVVMLVSVMIVVFIMKLYHHAETNATTLNRRVNELQIEALQAQINPHFLFNALNSINRFVIKEDSINANLYLTKLSKLIRTILENSRSNKVSLAQEIAILKMYIDIERIRLENKFDFTIEVAQGVDPNSTNLPPMIIQPYVENAIWHGIAPMRGKGKLEIDFTKIENFLTVIVRDNGAGRAKTIKNQNDSSHKSLGGKITEERIRVINLLSNQNSSIQIIDLTDKDGRALGTEVRINLSLNYYESSSD